MSQSLPCFALHDGRAGNARQSEALAHWLGGTSPSITLQTSAPWRWLAPRALPGAINAFSPDLNHLLTESPSIVIGCGRQAALATRLLRSDRVRSIQILDPRVDARHWDFIVVPAHDRLRGENVIVMQGSLNAIDDTWLKRHRDCAPLDIRAVGPLCAVLVGGPTTDTPYDLVDVLDAIAQVRGSFNGLIYVCTSSRTPADWTAAIRALTTQGDVRLWSVDDERSNPYPFLLACSTRIVCTADSVNMLSESCATALPVEYIGAARIRGRVANFVRALDDSNRIRALGRTNELQLTPLRESERVADEISQRLDALT